MNIEVGDIVLMKYSCQETYYLVLVLKIDIYNNQMKILMLDCFDSVFEPGTILDWPLESYGDTSDIYFNIKVM